MSGPYRGAGVNEGFSPLPREGRRWVLLPFLAVLAVVALNVFVFLGRLPLIDFDESRHGVTAYEMLKNGNYFVTTYLNNPDYWNLKPPLGAWLITVAYRVFGPSIFALRFFSAFFACLTVLLVMIIAKRHFGWLVSLASGCILATATGFIWGHWLHAGRTGEYDSGLTFLTTLALYLLDLSEEKPIAYYLSAFTASLAFLLKSFGAIPLLLILGILIVHRGKAVPARWIREIGFFFAFAVPILSWAILRYKFDGTLFFCEMVKYDILNRSLNAIEGNKGGPLYYFATLWHGFMPWSLLFPVVAVMAMAVSGRYYKKRFAGEGVERPAKVPLARYIFFYWTWVAVPLVVFSFAKTKVPWYINPAYPPLAILLGWGIVRLLGPSVPGAGLLYRSRVFLTGALFASMFLVAEGGIVKRLQEYIRSVNPAQSILYDLPESSYVRGSTLHLVGLSDQSVVFIAEAMKHLRLNSFTPGQFSVLRRRYVRNNILGIEMETRRLLSSTTGNFLTNRQPGDLIMLADTPDNRVFLASNNLLPLNQNDAWIIAGEGTHDANGRVVFRDALPCEPVDRLPDDITMPVRVNYGNKISLLGVTAKKVSGLQIKMSYYWRQREGIGSHNGVFVHFIGEDNKMLFQGDHPLCARQPFNALKGKIVQETQFIDVPSTAKGAQVTVKIGLYDVISKNYDRLKIESSEGAVIDDYNTRAAVGKLRL